MSKITLDETLRLKLNGLSEQVEVCDENGQSIGHFLPAKTYRELVIAWADSHVSEEELEQARREPGGRTLAEIWERLGRK